MNNLETLKAQLAEINRQIEIAKNTEKVFKQLQNTKLNSRTAHKYYKLQSTYL